MVYYEENQKFNEKPMWALAVIMGVMPALMRYLESLVSDTGFDNEDILTITAVSFSIGLFIILIFRLFEMKTHLDQQGVHMRMKPLTKKNIAWSDIHAVEDLDYGFVGGWGIRMTMRYGTVYNTRGRLGVLFLLKNNKKMVLGTQKPQEFMRAIERARQQGGYDFQIKNNGIK